MIDQNSSTKVRFDLWAVLAFLTLLGGISIGYLFSAQAENLKANQAICDRMTRLEANYQFIIDGIGKLDRGQERMAETLNQHERNTRKGRAE